MAVFWKNHLKEVDFSENALKEVPLGLFQLDVSLAALYFSFSALVRKPTP
jgi:leucine-rich repeat kinase 1